MAINIKAPFYETPFHFVRLKSDDIAPTRGDCQRRRSAVPHVNGVVHESELHADVVAECNLRVFAKGVLFAVGSSESKGKSHVVAATVIDDRSPSRLW